MDLQSQQIRDAFAQYDREVTIGNFKVACILGILLVPSFAILDFSLYPELANEFLVVRFGCSGLIAVFLTILLTQFGKKYYRFFTVSLVLLPGSAICYMIYRTPAELITNQVPVGADSPYYAGLNLVLLMTGFVLRWSFRESLVAVALVVLEYLLACRLGGTGLLHEHGVFLNNFFFLVATAIIVVTGNFFYSKFRYREFAYRLQLDLSKHELETTNLKLSEQNLALEKANREIKEAEMQLVQSEKLASLGRMSAGMIHEINNPLNFATTALFTLRKKGKYLAPEQQADYAEILTDVEEGVNRVKSIVSDLRMFTHPDTEQRDAVAVSEVVTAARRFLNNEDKIHFEQDLPANLTIWANKNMLIHVLTNLLQNSLDALKTKSFTDEKPTIRIAGRRENGVSFLTVHDNGPGIAAAHLDKIYDPFFTTKDVGDGMGLGLSICYRIVREAQGKISVNTVPGKFCEFTLEFPAVAPPSPTQ